VCERNLCAPRRSRARPSRVLWWPVFSPRLSAYPARQDGRHFDNQNLSKFADAPRNLLPAGGFRAKFSAFRRGDYPAAARSAVRRSGETGEPESAENIRDLYFRRQCPISNSDSDCAQHSATRPPGEMSVFSTDLAHGRYAATIRRAPCQDPERHSAALRSVCGGLAAAGEDGWALDDVAGAASTGRIGGRPHRSRCNEPASRT